MAEFELRCETCSFEYRAESLEDALDVEEHHKQEQTGDHQVTIERLRNS